MATKIDESYGSTELTEPLNPSSPKTTKKRGSASGNILAASALPVFGGLVIKEDEIKEEKLPFSLKLKIYALPIFTMIVSMFIFSLFMFSGIIGITLKPVNPYPILYFVQVLTTLLGILLSIAETCFIVVLVSAFVRIKHEEDEHFKKQHQILKSVIFDVIGDKRVRIRRGNKALRKVTMKLGLGIFTGMMFLNASVVCVFWAITDMMVYPHLPKYHGFYHFILVDHAIGLLAPILLMIGFAILLLIAQRISKYNFRAESLVPGLLSFVTFERGEEYCFWVIAKFFYFPIDKDNVADEGQKLTWAQRKLNINVSSWCILLILMCNVLLAIAVLTNDAIVSDYAGDTCNDVFGVIDEDYDCFSHSTWKFIDCYMNKTSDIDVICYKFLRTDYFHSADPLGNIIKSVFLYLAAEKFLTLLFNIVKTLMLFYQTKLWSIVVTIMGIAATSISVGTFIIYFVHHNTGLMFFSIFQFSVLSVDIMLAGFLLLLGSPMELVSNTAETGAVLLSMTGGSEIEKITEKLK